jgi:uncharacterized protein (TIRG00374 family)
MGLWINQGASTSDGSQGTWMTVRSWLTWLKSHAWVRTAISLALIGIFALLLPRDRFAGALHAINPVFLLSILPLYIVIHFVGALKWRLLVNQAGGSVAVARAASYYFAGLFGNLFLPSIVGGDMVMAGVAFKQGEERSSILIGSFMNRALDVLALVLLTSLGSAVTTTFEPGKPPIVERRAVA